MFLDLNEHNISHGPAYRLSASIASGARLLVSWLRQCYAASLFIFNVIYRQKDWNRDAIVRMFTLFPVVIIPNFRSQLNIFKVMALPAFRGIAGAQPKFPFKYVKAPYLAKGFTASKRARAFAHNYKFLDEKFRTAFVLEILHGGTTIYETTVGDNHYAVVMGLSTYPYNEGELSLEMRLNGARIYILSFTFVRASIIDSSKDADAILVSRIQGGRNVFGIIQAATKDLLDISPPHILFSALNGVAVATNVTYIFGTASKKQVTSGELDADVFKSAYDDFFISLGGSETVDGFFCFDVPLRNRQIEFIKRDHRSRTKKKRKFKARISGHAQGVATYNFRRPASQYSDDRCRPAENVAI